MDSFSTSALPMRTMLKRLRFVAMIENRVLLSQETKEAWADFMLVCDNAVKTCCSLPVFSSPSFTTAEECFQEIKGAWEITGRNTLIEYIQTLEMIETYSERNQRDITTLQQTRASMDSMIELIKKHQKGDIASRMMLVILVFLIPELSEEVEDED